MQVEGAHVVRRIELILIKRVVLKHLEHIGKKCDIAQEIKSHVIVDMLEFKVPPNSLGTRITCFRAVLTGQPN